MAYAVVIFEGGQVNGCPLSVNGNVKVMPNIGNCYAYGTINGNVDICQGSDLQATEGQTLYITGNKNYVTCSEGSGGDG